MVMQWLVVADDITGAAESAAAMGRGHVEPLLLTPRTDEQSMGLVVSTESRTLSGEGWLTHWSLWEDALCAYRPRWLVKKMDSLLRGPWLEESERLARLSGRSWMVVCPSLPDQDRIVVGGTLRWSRISEEGKPAKQASWLPGYFSRHLVITWRPGQELILPTLADGEMGVVVGDAASDGDLDALVRSVRDRPERVLWVGSRGLVSALGRYLYPRPVPAGTMEMGSPVLIMVGSQTEEARRQVQRLAQHVPIYRLDQVLEGERPDSGFDAVVTTHGIRGSYSEGAIDHMWKRALVMLLKRPWQTFLAMGGSTAASFLAATGARGLYVGALSRAGSVYTRVWGGSQDAKVLVTKSGSFGEEGALYELLLMIRSHSR